MEQALTQLTVKILFDDSIDFDEMRWTIILRDFRNAPFYIHCIFHMVNLRVFSLSLVILLHNGPRFAITSICSYCSF